MGARARGNPKICKANYWRRRMASGWTPGATHTPSRADPAVATVGEVDRAAD